MEHDKPDTKRAAVVCKNALIAKHVKYCHRVMSSNVVYRLQTGSHTISRKPTEDVKGLLCLHPMQAFVFMTCNVF